jgi:hypothetical protein
LPLLIEALPQFGLQGHDGIVECVRQGRRLGSVYEKVVGVKRPTEIESARTGQRPG